MRKKVYIVVGVGVIGVLLGLYSLTVPNESGNGIGSGSEDALLGKSGGSVSDLMNVGRVYDQISQCQVDLNVARGQLKGVEKEIVDAAEEAIDECVATLETVRRLIEERRLRKYQMNGRSWLAYRGDSGSGFELRVSRERSIAEIGVRDGAGRMERTVRFWESGGIKYFLWKRDEINLSFYENRGFRTIEEFRGDDRYLARFLEDGSFQDYRVFEDFFARRRASASGEGEVK